MYSTLKTYFGYDEFRPLQKDIIESVLSGKDNFVLMPTGGGKSLCYQLPALKLSGLTLVISPLIALMKDQVDALRANGIAAEFINSSLTPSEIEKVQAQAAAGKLKILYAAPERLALTNFKLFLKSLNLSLIAVDEAHCISAWGHDFRPDYRNLQMLKTIFAGVPIVALTATATEKVRADILQQLAITQAKVFVSSFNRPNLNLRVVKKNNAFAKLLALLKNYKNQSVIIYCFSRKDTESLAADLKSEGFKAASYHAGLEANQRRKTQELFIKDEINIIVATIAFGMGIDKPDVRLVVHYTFPKSLEGYYQEVGRAGRDGLPSDCVMFYTYADARKHEYFLNDINDEQLKKQTEQKLQEVMTFAELRSCRRRHILNYFGEKYTQENCEACDCCTLKPEVFDGTIISQKILSAILRTGSRFGANHIIGVLLGKKQAKIFACRHHELSVFGLVKDFSADDLKDIISQLIHRGLLVKTADQYATLTLTTKGAQFLSARETINLDRLPTETGDKVVKDLVFDQVLFEKLRVLRKQLADDLNVPPFVIFSDSSLQEMAYYFPSTKESFALITGVGARKLESFGEEFLKIIKTHLTENNLTSREVPVKRSRTTLPKQQKTTESDTLSITLNLINKKLSLADIAKARGLAFDTIVSHLERLVDGGAKLDLNHLKPSLEVFNKIKNAFSHCGTEKLKPVFEYLNEEYDYELIRLVRVLIKIDSN